jgi:DNA (cytosine-5)-methyltransferase 1
MSSGVLPEAPIWDDIRTFEGARFKGCIDIICGGFPCQDISVAGAGKGLEGERSGLFSEVKRLCSEIKPRFIFLENVPAITSRGGTRVVRELASLGYDCRWCVISAASVGARHVRKRWFLLGYSQHARSSATEGRSCDGVLPSSRESKEECQAQEVGQSSGASSLSSDVAHTDSERQQEAHNMSMRREEEKSSNNGEYLHYQSREHWQETVDGICRVSDGIPYQVDRIKSLGNAVVPAQVQKAFKILMGLK